MSESIDCDLPCLVEAKFADVPDALWQPGSSGSGSTAAAFFQKWVKLGVFAVIHRELVAYYHGRRGAAFEVEFEAESLGQRGVKRHILTDGRGVPIAAVITGANVPENEMLPGKPQPVRHACLPGW